MAAAKAKASGARKCMTRRIPKPEGRRPKEGRNPKPECGRPKCESRRSEALRGSRSEAPRSDAVQRPRGGSAPARLFLRISDFGLPSAFGLRVSVFPSPPPLRLPQLLEQQVLQIGVGTGGEEVDAAALAVLAQALHEVLHGLPIGFQAEAAKGHLLHGAGFGVHKAQAAERRG